MLSWRDREERVAARGLEYRAGQISEAHFRAYLFSMHLRGEDIRHKLSYYAPSPLPATFEEKRMSASRQWLKEYHRG